MAQGRARARFRRCFPAIGLLALANPASADSARLNTVDGLVLIDQGAGFSKGREGGVLVPGQRLFVTEGAAAMVDFPDGCRVHVRANTLYSLPQSSPCNAGEGRAKRIGPHYAAAIGDVEVPAEPADGQRVETEQREPESAADEEPWYKQYALPAALTGLGLGALSVLSSGGGSSDPAGSPGPLTGLSPE